MLFRGRLFSRPAAEHHGGSAIKWHGSTLAMKNKNIRLLFWKWAHDASEQLWHWIYYHRIPEGIAQRERIENEHRGGSWTYSFAYVNRKGEIPPHSDGIRIHRPSVMKGEIGRCEVVEIDSESPAKTHLG